MVMALAILLTIALLAWPALLTRSTVPRLSATALDTAALLRDKRAEAGREGQPIRVTFDLNRREIASGDTIVTLAPDLTIDMTTDRRCRLSAGVYVVTFHPDGRSCGGVFSISKDRISWRVAINWMTGAIDAKAIRS